MGSISSQHTPVKFKFNITAVGTVFSVDQNTFVKLERRTINKKTERDVVIYGSYYYQQLKLRQRILNRLRLLFKAVQYLHESEFRDLILLTGRNLKL